MKRTPALAFTFLSLAAMVLSATAVQIKAETVPSYAWTAKAPMPTERIYLGAVAVNGVVYAMGGFHYQMINSRSTNDMTNVTEAYNPVTDTWVTKAPMPTPLAKFGIATIQSKIYCIGGNTTEIYDTKNESWQTGTPMPTARTDLQANVVDGKIFIIGGMATDVNGYQHPLTLNEAYDPATDAWATMAPIPFAAAGYVSAVVDGKIYIISDTVQVYDPRTDTWNTGASIPTVVKNAAAATIPASLTVYPGHSEETSAILVFGGTTPDDPFHATDLTQIYSPRENNWMVGPSLLYPRSALAATMVNGAIFALGGGQNLFNPQSNANQQYGPNITQAPANSATPTPSPSTTLTPTPTSLQTPLSSSTPTRQPTAQPTPSPSIPEFPSLILLPVAGSAAAFSAAWLTKRNRNKRQPASTVRVSEQV